MIAFLGDLHGNFFKLLDAQNKLPKGTPLIQVGDFGYWGQLFPAYIEMQIKQPFYFIEGNHDDVDDLLQHKQPFEVWPKAVYVPRGTVLEIAGKQIMFFGGAKSVDRKFRVAGTKRRPAPLGAWFKREVPSEAELERAIKAAEGKKIDILVTHTPSAWMLSAYCGFGAPTRYGLGKSWKDEPALLVDTLWHTLGEPYHVCGHMHRNLAVRNQVRMLGIDELWVYDLQRGE